MTNSTTFTFFLMDGGVEVGVLDEAQDSDVFSRGLLEVQVLGLVHTCVGIFKYVFFLPFFEKKKIPIPTSGILK